MDLAGNSFYFYFALFFLRPPYQHMLSAGFEQKSLLNIVLFPMQTASHFFFLPYIKVFYFTKYTRKLLFPTGTAATASATKAEGRQARAGKGSTCWRKALMKLLSSLKSDQHVIKSLIKCTCSLFVIDFLQISYCSYKC